MKIDNIDFKNLTRQEAIAKIIETKNTNLLPLAIWISDSIECQKAYENIRVVIADAERATEGICKSILKNI